MSVTLAVDYGRRRSGIAISGGGGLFAQPLDTIVARNPADAASQIATIIAEREVRVLVVGLPLDQDGDEGPMATEVRAWAEKLAEDCDTDLVLFDERMTSSWAKQADLETRPDTHRGKKRGKGDKGRLDQLAAVAILEDYLRSSQGSGT